MTAKPLHIGTVVEGPDDARTVPELTDRILSHEVPALSGKLDRARAYRGLDPGTRFFAWSQVDREAGRRGVPRKHGHFGRAPAIEDARTAVLALRCFVAQDPQPAAVLLVRDSDGRQDERVRGLEQARQEFAWPFEVLLGVAHPMRECWVLAGFVPQDKREEASLKAIRKELGFNPTLHSDRLDASMETAKKSPKRVLEHLTGGDRERETQCWADADLEQLRERGERNGLSAFMREIGDRLVPVFARGGPAPDHLTR